MRRDTTGVRRSSNRGVKVYNTVDRYNSCPYTLFFQRVTSKMQPTVSWEKGKVTRLNLKLPSNNTDF